MNEENKTSAMHVGLGQAQVDHHYKVVLQQREIDELKIRIADLERQLADEHERSKAWHEFRQLVQLHHACPPDISADFIRAIMAVLKEE